MTTATTSSDFVRTLYDFLDTRLGTVVLHLLAWFAYVLLISVQWSYAGGFDLVDWAGRVAWLAGTFAVPVYVNLFLWSRATAKNRYGLAVTGYVVVVLGWSYGAYYLGSNGWTGRDDSLLQWHANTSLTVFLSVGIRAIYRGVRRERELQQLRARTAESEVASLRAQLNPHFLFNTLNNIYAAILDDGPRGAALVLKLSRVMRYHYDLSAQPSVPLESEVALIRAVIELERLRLSGLTEARTSLPGETGARHHLPPLLLVPLVENAFKHGAHPSKAGFVDISLCVTGDRLSFTVTNSIHEHLNAVRTGVGLANLRARLQLLYGATDYTFTSERDGDQWRAHLEIPLSAVTDPVPAVLAKAEPPASKADLHA